jgi:predicted sugar kinase
MTDSTVSVTVPARLHLGFLDLDGGLGRRFGSLGMALDGPSRGVRTPNGRPSTCAG